MDLHIINNFLRITPINKANVSVLFLQQIHDMDSWRPPLSPEEKQLRIQELEYHCSLYITKLAFVGHEYPDLATNVLKGKYVLKKSFIIEALYVDPDRRFGTQTLIRQKAIIKQAHLRVIRMGFLLKVINEWNNLDHDKKKEKMDTFLRPSNEDSDYEPELDAESVLGTQDIPQQFPPEEIPQQFPPEEARQPLGNIDGNIIGGFKYTSRNKKKKQKIKTEKKKKENTN